jgi:hypothetical protein
MKQADLSKLDALMTKLQQFNVQNASQGTILQANFRFASDGSVTVIVWVEDHFELVSVASGEVVPIP